MKKGIFFGIIFIAILLTSGMDISIEQAVIYGIMYLFGKTCVYHFESKKMAWKKEIKSVLILMFFSVIYHFCAQTLVHFKYKPFDPLSKFLRTIGFIILAYALINISFILPYQIIKKKVK